jgi:hypothetical protein
LEWRLGAVFGSEADLTVDEQTLRLHFDRAALVQKISVRDKELRNVHWIFLAGLGVMLVGIFLLWALFTHVTLYTIGQTRYVADPMSFGAFGALFAAIGFVALVSSIYIRIFYPSKLENLRQDLQELNSLLAHQKVFPPEVRKVLGKSSHAYYEDYLKETKRIKSLDSIQKLLDSYIYALCLITAGLYVIIEGCLNGHFSDGATVGGPILLVGGLWAFWKYRKRKRKQ